MASDPRIPDLPTRSDQRIASDVNIEINEWLQERSEELRAAGLSAQDALAQARTEFGDVEATREYCATQDRVAQRRSRLARWADEAVQDLRVAFRTIVRAPTISAILLVIIALGVGATTTIYSVVHAVLLSSNGYRDESSLVQVHGTEQGTLTQMGQMSSRAYLAFRDGSRSLSGIAATSFTGGTITGDGDPENVVGLRVSANLFDVLGAHAALGRTFVAGEDSAGVEPVVLLSHRLWQRRYGGDSSIVGGMIVESGVSRRVVGVMPSNFVMPFSGNSEFWIPLDLTRYLADPERSHKFRVLQLVARIKPGVTQTSVQADFDQIYLRLTEERPDAYTRQGARAVNLRDVSTGNVRPALLTLLVAAVVLLLISCANIASVLLARTIGRQQELALRSALGAGRGRIVRQLLVESLALSLIGGALGGALTFAAVPVLAKLGARSLPAGTLITVNQGILTLTLIASIACGILFGLAPSFAAGRVRAESLVGGRASEMRTRTRLRRGLVMAQVSLSAALLVGAGLLTLSLQRLTSVDLGYQLDQRMTFGVGLPSRRYDTDEKYDAFFSGVFEQLEAIPGVTSVAYASSIPIHGSSGASLAIEGRPVEGDRLPEVRYGTTSDDYFATMDIPLLRGRVYGKADVADRGTVVTESAAKRFWGDIDPIGARIKLGPDPASPWHTVVGVVGDVIIGPSGTPRPTVYTSMRYDRWGGGELILRFSGDPAPIRRALFDAVKKVDPLLAISPPTTLDELRSNALSDRRLPMQLIAAFSALAVIIASVGLYGVAANAVASRRRELGIRLALGAPASRVRHLVLRDGIALVAGGLLFGIPLSLFAATLMRPLLFEVGPFSAPILAAVAVLLLLVGVAANAVPARRATRVDPVASLKQ